MTDNNHPITPPPELVRQIRKDALWSSKNQEDYEEQLIIVSYRNGADQELYACCEWLQDSDSNVDTYELRSARRPKPPSPKEQALAVLSRLPIDPEAGYCPSKLDTIRLALEQLPD